MPDRLLDPAQRPVTPTGPELRLAELVAAFSLVSDLVMGHPSDEAMRACLLATGLARAQGQGEATVADVYWTTLLAHSGCTAFAHEQAALFAGDDIAVNAAGSKADFTVPREILAFLQEVTRGRRMLDRARIVVGAATAGKAFDHALATANCEIARTVADRLELGEGVVLGLLHMFERWDGKGAPEALRGDAIAPAARFAQVAHQATVYARIGGLEAATEMAKRRAGTALDPTLAEALARDPAPLRGSLEALDPWHRVLDAEPEPCVRIPAAGMAQVAEVFANVADLKSPVFLGHSKGVADLATAAAGQLGMSVEEVESLRVAALLHDLGRASVPNGVWEKSGPLTSAEWEQVRLHPYHTERILLRAAPLATLAPVAGMHHERLDGSGYHRQLAGPAMGLPARVLATSDAFQAMGEARPHRPALRPDEAAALLTEEAREGRFDPGVVEAVLAGAGRRRRPGRPSQAGDLTERQVEVLVLIAQGLSNREVGRRLFIAPKTVGRHVEHIYDKLGIRSRAAAALFAVTHGLLEPRDPDGRKDGAPEGAGN